MNSILRDLQHLLRVVLDTFCLEVTQEPASHQRTGVRKCQYAMVIRSDKQIIRCEPGAIIACSGEWQF